MRRRISAREAGKPLADIRAFVSKFGSFDGIGAQPPIILAALRKRMVALAAEIADGLVFANAARSHMAASLGVLPADKRDDPHFFIGSDGALNGSRRSNCPHLHWKVILWKSGEASKWQE